MRQIENTNDTLNSILILYSLKIIPLIIPLILSFNIDTSTIPNTSPRSVFSIDNTNNIIDNVYTHNNNPLWSGTFNQITDNNLSFDSSSN